MKGIRVLLACIRKADKDYNFINNGDKVVIGVSGGKDSMALLYALHLYKKFSLANFEIYPCMIDLGFDNFNPDIISEYTAKLGYNLKILDEKQVYQILKIQKEKQKTPRLPCSICSKMKKAIINKYAIEINANKVAFAHHKDDAIETLFLNEIYGGRIATFSPKMHLSNDDITFIRPFIYVNEKTIIKTIKEENIPHLGISCPNDKHTEREEIKNILKLIYEKYPCSEENFLTMLLNHTKEDLFYMHSDHKIEGTDLSYKLVTNIDDFIKYKKCLNNNISEEDKDTFKFLIYKNNKIIGASAILKISPKNYKLIHLNLDDEEDKNLFKEDIKKELFQRFNPFNFIE